MTLLRPTLEALRAYVPSPPREGHRLHLNESPQDLPDEVKKRLYLVHIAAKDVPHDAGLRAAREGLEHTLRVEPSAVPRFGDEARGKR